MDDESTEIEGIGPYEFVCHKCRLVANRGAKLPSGVCADHDERPRIVGNRW